MNRKTLLQIITIRKLEKQVTKNFQDFGGEGNIYLHKITATIAKKDPELLKEIDRLIDEMEKEEVSKT